MRLALQSDWREHAPACGCRQCSAYRGTEAVHDVIKRTIQLLTWDVPPPDHPLPPDVREAHAELLLCATSASERLSSLLESWRMGTALPVPDRQAGR